MCGEGMGDWMVAEWEFFFFTTEDTEFFRGRRERAIYRTQSDLAIGQLPSA